MQVAAGLSLGRSEIGYAVGGLIAARAGHCPHPFGGRVPRTPSLSRLQTAGGPAGVPPVGLRAILEACLRHDPHSRSEIFINVSIILPSGRLLSTGRVSRSCTNESLEALTGFIFGGEVARPADG